MLGVVVGEVLDDLEGDRRVLFEPADHLRARVDIGRGEFGDDPIVRQRVQVAQGLLAGVVESVFGHGVVARNPDHAAGHRGCSTDDIGLLEDADSVGAESVRRDGGSESGCARPQNDHVEVVAVAHGLWIFRSMLAW